MGLIELIFHIKNGFFCPECGEEIGFDKVKEDLEKIMKEMKINKKSEEEIDAVKMVYFNKIATCPKCNGKKKKTTKEFISESERIFGKGAIIYSKTN